MTPSIGDQDAVVLGEGGVRLTRRLLACGLIGPVLFIVTFLVEGATRDAYSPLRHPVSSLSLGGSGWTQIANFLLAGLLLVAFALGIRRRGLGTSAPVLMALVGIGLIGAGIFAADPISGYPPGTAPAALERTTHGVLHDLFSTPVFTALPAACLVLARRFARHHSRGWANYSVATAVGFLACFVLSSLAFRQNPALVSFGGLFQRLALIIGLCWVAAVAAHLQRSLRPGEPTSPLQR
jgi:hypothetical protein